MVKFYNSQSELYGGIRLKNSFIKNKQNEIRHFLNEIE